MAFENLPLSAPARRRSQKAPVFCVGWHAFVNWPMDCEDRVPAMDREGSPVDNNLADGDEVEILSWQPRSRRGLLYEVRRVGDGTEWWLGASHLRGTLVADAEPGCGIS